MIGSNALNTSEKYRLFPLLSFYEQEKWNLIEHHSFKKLTDNQKKLLLARKHVIDFKKIKSKIVSNEIRAYCQHIIEEENRLLNYFATYIGGIELTINFINKKLTKINSLVEVEIKRTVESYSHYLKDAGYKTHTIARNALNERMESQKHKNPTVYLRFFINLLQYVHDQYKESNQGDNFFERDKWDIRELPFQVQGFDPSRPRYTISFDRITQEKVKNVVKKYIVERLKTNKYLTCIDDLKGINMLSEYLNEFHPTIESLGQLNREIIEGFLAFINLNSNLKPRTKSSRIGVVKTFFEFCTLMGWDDVPKQTLILSDDVKKKYKVLPKYYEDDVITQINKNLESLPVQIARMVYVLQNVGMRVSELCNLEVDCLKQDTENDYLLEYFQGKTGDWNRVPIKEDVAMAIQKAISYSQEQYGSNVKYVFLQDRNKPISKDTFSYHLNQLIKKKDIRNSNGDLVRIKAHHFRGTLATKYANLGMSPNVIRILLGQKSLGAIRHYVEILEETMTDAMQNLLDYQDQMIQSIGKEEAVIQVTKEDEVEIPLPNGSCAKPLSSGKCTHANACYTCAMFKPDPNNIELFRYQLSEAKNNVEMAKINGFERVQQVNEDLVSSLEKIITSIEKRGA